MKRRIAAVLRGLAAVLGLIGGISGLLATGAVLALADGYVLAVPVGEGLDAQIGSPWGAQTLARALLALSLSIIGLVGAPVALKQPRASALLMLVAGAGGLLAIGGFYVVSGPLLIYAALLAFVGRTRLETEAAAPQAA